MSEQQPENSAPEAVQGMLFSVGNLLREERMRHGLSVDEVYNRIKFAPRQIEALEADNFAELPEPAFVRGFVRSYAKLLQVDPEPLIAALPHPPERPSLALEEQALGELPFPGSAAERKQNIVWLAAALGVAVLLALVAWLVGGKSREAPAPEPQKSTVENLPLPEVIPVSATFEDESPEMKPEAAKNRAEVPAPITKPPVPAAPAAPAAAPAKPVTPQPVAVPAPAKPTAAVPVASALKPANPPPAKPVAAAPAPAPVAQSAVKPAVPFAPAKPVPAASPAQTAAKAAAPARPASAVAAVPSKAAATPPKPADASSSRAAIRLSFVGDSWVEVKDKDGKILLSVIGKPGMEHAVNGTPPFTVNIGYSSGVKLFYKGKQVELSPHARQEVSHLTLE